MNEERYLYVRLMVQGRCLFVDLAAENHGRIFVKREDVVVQLPYPGPALPGGISFDAFWEEMAPLFGEFEVVGCGLSSAYERTKNLLWHWGIRLVLPSIHYTDLSDLAGHILAPSSCTGTALSIKAGIAPVFEIPGPEDLKKIAGFLRRNESLRLHMLRPKKAAIDTGLLEAPGIRRRRLQKSAAGKDALSLRGCQVLLAGSFRTGSREKVRQLLKMRGAIVGDRLRTDTDYVIVGDRSAETGENAAAALLSNALRRQRRRGKPRILTEQRVFPCRKPPLS